MIRRTNGMYILPLHTEYRPVPLSHRFGKFAKMLYPTRRGGIGEKGKTFLGGGDIFHFHIAATTFSFQQQIDAAALVAVTDLTANSSSRSMRLRSLP